MALEPLMIDRLGIIKWMRESIGKCAPCLVVEGSPIPIGAGTIIAGAIGMMIQQDALDRHKLSLMGRSNTVSRTTH